MVVHHSVRQDKREIPPIPESSTQYAFKNRSERKDPENPVLLFEIAPRVAFLRTDMR